jgi:hypothetical protein
LPWAAAISALVGFHGIGAVRLINEFLLESGPKKVSGTLDLVHSADLVT